MPNEDLKEEADKLELQEAKEDVVDEAESEAGDGDAIRYDITSYGADFDVQGLVKRLNDGNIKVPDFQRAFIWTLKDSSKFIESLLLGLPVPGIFLNKEKGTNKLLVIDGQQRLRSLEYFYGGIFNPKEGEKRQRVFELDGVHKTLEGKTYATLTEPDKLRLNDSIIHATIIKQDAPAEDDTSINHVFQRLNSQGRRLFPQEIRSAINEGPLVDLLEALNENPRWRDIYGRPSPRLKDQELILRFLALYFEPQKYRSPMNEFLDKFLQRHSKSDPQTLAAYSSAFSTAIDAIHASNGARAFRPERSVNAAVFDAVMVGLAKRLETKPKLDPAAIGKAYGGLLVSPDFVAVTSKATANEKTVASRIQLATAAFAGL